jgi:adenosylmethionine-8-amino-7-oxononanoate aminotransferase
MFPLSVTSCTQVIFDAFLSDEVSRGFFHAHTYSAHPLGCAAALAALNLLDSNEIKENINEIAKAHKKFVDHIKTHPKVQDARTKGVIMAVDLKVETQRYGALRDRLYQFYMDRGVNLRPLGNTVYTVPPYIISQQNLQKIYSVIEESLSII